jgi:hypothetical protein
MENEESFMLSGPFATETEPVVIRGHTLLCLQGFRGEGYDHAFIDNMTLIHRRLQKNPGTRILVSDRPDHLCAACPNLKGGCTLRGPNFEEHIVAQDRQVLELLGLEVGQEVTWAEVLGRIGSRVRGEMLDGICGDCRWLSSGFCKEGIEALRVSNSF